MFVSAGDGSEVRCRVVKILMGLDLMISTLGKMGGKTELAR